MRTIATGVVLVLSGPAAGQLRVVSWNTLEGPGSISDANYRTVLAAVAADSVNGIARRPDVIALQEQDASSTADLAALLKQPLRGEQLPGGRGSEMTPFICLAQHRRDL